MNDAYARCQRQIPDVLRRRTVHTGRTDSRRGDPEHFEEWWGYGVFFFVAAFAQVAYGVLLLLRPWAHDATGGERNDPETDRRTVAYYIAGIAGNLAIIALWVVTRTAGIPFFGPHAGDVEQVTWISLASKVIEAALIVCLIALIRRTHAPAHGTGVMA